MKFKTYLVRLAHDAGTITLAVASYSARAAIRTVLATECAPRRAVLSVRVHPS